MGDSLYAFTEGVGRNQRTFQRTVGGTAVEELTVVPSEPFLASYGYFTPGVLVPANVHLLQVMAGASNRVGIRRIVVSQVVLAGAVTLTTFELRRLTTAGTGGTAGTAQPYDPADSVAGATVRHAVSASKGTEGVAVCAEAVSLVASGAATTMIVCDWEFGMDGRTKVPWIAAGTANGFALKATTAVGTAQLVVQVDLVEASWA